eukprot:gene10529-7314_t
MSGGRQLTFHEKLEDSAHAKIPPRNQLQANVNVCIDRASNPQAIYKFQNPKSFSFKRRNDEPGSRVHEKGMPMHPSKKRKAECDCDERDVELLRMIQRASRKPQIKDEGKPVAPNDELLINTLQTAEDAIAFFSANGSKSDVKYILLNRKSRKLEFRPYDLLVVPNGSEDPEHYIMSATGVVHIHPGYPSEVVSLSEWMRESSLFIVLRKIPYFKNYLLYKAFFRLHQNLRARQYAATRKRLAKDFLLTTHTFSGHGLDLAKATYELSSVPIIMYEPQGKHDYFVDEFSLQQSKQRQKGASAFNTIVEKIEGKLGKLIEVLQRRADVPDLNTQEALEQYLQANAITDGKEAGGKRKIRSMLDAKKEQFEKMRELKRSIVEYSKLHIFIRLVDIMASENLFHNVLSTTQTLLNTLRRQHLEEIRTLGFQVLLVPTDVSMLFNPTEDNVKELCNEVFTGCTDVVGNANRLCDQRFFKSYFSKTPKIWNISSELKRDARINYIQESTLNLVHEDYEQANNRMTTYATTLPHIHFLLKEWPVIEQEWKEQQNEEILSCQSLTKIYQRLQEAQNALRVLMSSFVGNILWINAGKLKSEIEPRMHVLREGIDSTLRITTCNLIKELNTYFKQKTQQLNLRPQVLREFADYVGHYKQILMGSTKLDNDVAQAEALCDVMDRQQVEFLEDEDKQLKERTLGNTTTSAVSLHVIFDEARLHADEFIEENMAAHIETLQSEVANVEEECAGVQQILSGEDFSAISDNTEGMLECLADIKGRIDAIKSGEEELTRFGRLFDVPPFDWTIVSDVTSLYNARQDMWSLLDMFNKKIEYWFDCPVKVLNTQEMEEEVNLMIRRAGNGNRVMAEKSYEDELAQHLLNELQTIRVNLSVIHDCGNKHMTPDHWNIVLKAMTGAAYSYHDGLSLRTLQERNVFHFKEVLAEQSGLATGEWKITNDLDLIKQVWDGINFGTKSYKNLDGVYILDSLDEIIQQLDDHQIELQTIMASRFVAPVKDKVESWIKNLRLVSDVIEEWITLQKNWMYLEFIFSSDDIKEQLPEESEQFSVVDRLFRSLTSKAHTVQNVYQICTEDDLLEELRKSNESIDHIQKKLEDYLETKRIAFPRFYFLSNDELLSILSDVRNPKSVQPHLPKCFDSIASLIFADEACTEIVGMQSGEGENVTFESTVYPIGSIEQWLNEIESMMKASLLMHMRKTWFFDHPAQCIQAVDMVVWTGEVEEAINSASLRDYHSEYQQQILRTVELVKTQLSKLHRTLVCTLIVLNVHSRDIIQMLADKNITAVGDFSWYQQLRYYWEEDPKTTGGMNVGIQHCSAHLWYGYEYLGNQPRLVITPLTDRAFLTCTSALGMNLGAAPQGPAGTGKTESVKDLGKALARQVVVFNCSDGINYKTMSRMFAGLAQAGAWACFDEFNRIELEVLSVIAQQMLEITTALGQNLERMNFDGHPICLSRNFGVFITMNPGYAGRTELPDNLKALFRPICMMIPDYALIAEIMFYSEGFADARTLAQKMVQLYKLSSEQLSKQDHYDFGMRAVKSILVMAGALKRQHPHESEDIVLIRAMKDANVPKFLRDDTILFMALVKDLFPTVEIVDNQNELLVKYLTRAMTNMNLQIVEGIVTKSLQLFDTLVVRHGVMMVGQTLTAKTTVIRSVQKALTMIKKDNCDPEGNTPLFNEVFIHLLNPKSVTMGELYGQVNEITREWTDGILSDIARNVTRGALTSPSRHWIVFDGPVDAVWIENMNTVLDDNKLLCLFNGERIKLPGTATFMFEVQDLAVASPATVSRCGMVFMECYYLDQGRGWIPIATSLVNEVAKKNPRIKADRLLQLLNDILPSLLDFMRKNCREWIPSCDAQLAINCIQLLNSIMLSMDDDSIWPHDAVSETATESKGLELDEFGMPMESKGPEAYDPPEEFRRLEITETPVAADADRLFDMYFAMSLVWTVGGNLRDDSRECFSKKAKEVLLKALGPEIVSLPDSISMFEYVVHRPSMKFITWTHLVPNFVYDPTLPYFELVVPTSESVALKTVLSLLTSTSQHVLVNGVTGTGKSLGMLSFISESLKGDDPSANPDPCKDIEDRLEAKLYKVRSNVLGPTPGKRAVFFIDDLNMPALEKYGASPPLELIRQLITQKGFFDKHKTPAMFKELHDVVFLAAAGVPGGGRNDITMRLTSRFHLICQPTVSEPSMQRIFGSIIFGFLRQWESEEILALYSKIIAATKECFERISLEKLPTPTRSHYTFNLRDFSKVIQGIMQVTPTGVSSVDQFSRLFVHEVSRTFHDRLVDDEDRKWWWKTVQKVAEDILGLTWVPEYCDILYGDYTRHDRALYQEISDYELVQEVLREFQGNYNMEYNKEVELVFFKDAVNHVSRICRILRQPRGNALLVGMGGTGRQSLCKLSAFICNLPIYEVSITRSFSMVEFRDSMKKVLLDSGCHEQPVLFFMSDAQIVYEEMLEDINNLLNTGEIPNLMQSEDMDGIVTAVRPFASAAGKQETRNVIISHFVSLCRDNVHVVLAMSPIGDQFRRRLRMFPSLVNCCTIDWFDQWPSEALAGVATRVLSNVQLPDDVKERLIELCVQIHVDVQSSSEEFYEELHRRNYTTPTSYLELLTCYRKLLEEQDKIVVDQINRYQGGLDTLRSTQTTVDEMKEKLVAMQPKLVEAAKNTEELMERVEKEQEIAEVKRKECAAEEAEASGTQAEADGIQEECQLELDKAMPILKAAEDALADLNQDAIREVRSFKVPNDGVKLVLGAVLTLLREKNTGWDRAKVVMSNMNFIKMLQEYDKDSLDEKIIRSLQPFLTKPEFRPENVKKSSIACMSLSMWVSAMASYYSVVKIVRPKQERLKEATAKAEAAAAVVAEAQERLRETMEKVAGLQRKMQETIVEKKRLEDEMDLTTIRLERAEQLMSGLSSEQTRWSGAIASLAADKSVHVPKIAVAAGFVAYLGPFTSTYRERLIEEWSKRCTDLDLPLGDKKFELASIVDPVTIRTWSQKGLPPDAFSVENGVIATKSQRWCLCIDPQGQAVNWIRMMERDNNLRVIKLTEPNYMRTLENAIRVGLPVLIENVEESLDAALDPVLLRQTYRSQGRLLIKVGDSEVDYDPNFRLYITTKLANPHYLPELQIKVTIINFTVTQLGLENQLLADVVRFEFAELEQRATKTVMDIANGKNELKELEDKILRLLSSSSGNILDNEQLVNTLQSSKKTSEAVTEALSVAEETQKDIDTARNRYRPVATRGSTIYTVVSALSGLDHMYQNSLEFFKQLFIQTLQRTEKKEDVDERVAVLLPAVSLSSYNTICRGLFEKDKLIFAFLLYSFIARQQGEIPDDEYNFLLKGSAGKRFVDSEEEPPPVWMQDQAWNEAAAISQLLPKKFGFLKDDLYDSEEEWTEWYGSDKAYDFYPSKISCLPLWEKLLVLKALKEDLLNYGLALLIADRLGKEFTESPAFDLDGCYMDSSPTAPIIFVLTPGTDPTQLFTEFAERRGFGSRKLMLSLGQDQGKKAEEMIRTAVRDGMWVYLQNCHVYTSWMPSLERILEELQLTDLHRDFRLWLTTMPIAAFPVLLLQSGVKLVKEPPKGLKANIRDTFNLEISEDIWDSCSNNATTWRRLLFSLTYFHAVIQERRKFGPLGWNIPYEWNQSDLSASLKSLSTYISDEGEDVPWNALNYMIGIINYGGRVTDFLDNRCLTTILSTFFNDEVTKPKQFNITEDGVYCIPEDVSSLDKMKEYLSNLPPFESPELFGLHSNAVITFNRTTVRRQLAAILSVQPRTKAAAGATPEEKVMEIVVEFQRRLPKVIDKSKASPETYRILDDGTMISLGTVAGQEIDVFNAIVTKLDRTLLQLARGIKGEVVMSVELEAMFEAMILGQVPQLWHDGGYLSRKPLASWFEDTLQRVDFFREWNDQGVPTSFWISGFFFPQGFLTGVLQTFSRQHKIPIDDVKFKTNMTPWEVMEDIGEEVDAGVYIHGLFLEGARYDVDQQCIMESRKGELFTKVPIIHLEPVRLKTITSTDKTYACPVYKTSARVGVLSTTGLSTNFVVSLDLTAGIGVSPKHWIQRGVAMLCMLDD